MSIQSPLIGNLAPDFDLGCTPDPETGRQHVSLSDYRGRWLVLLFYPRDFSLVCPTELMGLSRHVAMFRERGCSLLGVSCDSLDTHEHWLTAAPARGGLGGLAFPLASDPDGVAARSYGVFLEYQRVALRGLFIIDPNGVLQYQAVHNLSLGRRTDDVLRILAALQTGGLCAENWSSPEDTLDPAEALVPNSVFSHYRIEAVIGKGSFATVFRARDLTLNRSVALKVFKRGGPITASTVLAEARSAAALNHPNVCTVFGVDDSLGVPAISMEYVPGRPLNRLLSTGRLDCLRSATIGRQIAEGMAEAHAEGVVHGDLKPENIMVADGDAVKILDFGLSRRQHLNVATDETVTLGIAEGADTGGLFGTPRYLSPEQTRGEQASQASDLFALGLILYEMLAGRAAFESLDLLTVLSQIRQTDPETFASAVPEPFASILRKALHPQPDHRAIDMKATAGALARFLDQHGSC